MTVLQNSTLTMETNITLGGGKDQIIDVSVQRKKDILDIT